MPALTKHCCGRKSCRACEASQVIEGDTCCAPMAMPNRNAFAVEEYRTPVFEPEATARSAPAQRTRAKMIVEMRTYKTKPGKRAEFLEIFRTKSVPAHDEIGMKILGPFLSVEDPDTFFFMRGFPDLASREPMKAKFYEGELWKRELEVVLLPMLEKYEVVLVEDADEKIRW